MLSSIFFYVFAVILILSAVRVVTAKNPVHAVLFLVLAFVTAACLWLMLNVEFLALVLILVYVGAVMVLFLFVVMMLDVDHETLRVGFWQNLPLAVVLGLVILVEMIAVLVTKPLVLGTNVSLPNLAQDNTYNLFMILYTKYYFAVELASIILLLGLIVATALTLRSSPETTKFQKIKDQLNADPKQRLQMVKMAAVIEVETPDAVENVENPEDAKGDK